MKNVGIVNVNGDYLIEMLCKMSFLGQEVKQDIFEFSYNEDQFRKYDAIARKNISRNNITDCRYKIHKAFHVESLRVHSPMLASRKLAPSVARLGRIPRSCEAGGKHPCGV